VNCRVDVARPGGLRDGNGARADVPGGQVGVFAGLSRGYRRWWVWIRVDDTARQRKLEGRLAKMG
jgi:hypothetical protein